VSKNSPQAWTQQFVDFRCRDCGSEVGFRSRRRTLAERYLFPLLLLQPVRCGECFRRDYRLIFTPVKPRLSQVNSPLPSARQPSPPLKRNVA
jgi:hypothetical protein